MTKLERFRGCLLGLAIGDALGTTLEFRAPGTFEPIADMIGGGPFHLEPGQWTDDTSMALCLATSLIEQRGFDAQDQMRRYVRWWREGYLSSTDRCFDIGNTVRTALSRFEQTGDPWAGSTDKCSAGNGSLMRLAPVPLFFSSDAVNAIERSAESSRTTHGTTAAVDACRYFAGLIVGTLQGATKAELLGRCYSPVPGYWAQHPMCEDVEAVANGSFKAKPASSIKGSGYVIDSMEAALWAFYRTTTFREGALLAVNLGDDADTTGAIYGQLAGAFYGEQGLPQEWRGRIAQRELITACADKLTEFRPG